MGLECVGEPRKLKCVWNPEAIEIVRAIPPSPPDERCRHDRLEKHADGALFCLVCGGGPFEINPLMAHLFPGEL